MKPELIVSDWNGTLITDLDDKAVLKQIGMDELKHSALRPRRWGRVKHLFDTKKQLETLVAKYRSDRQAKGDLLRDTLEIYNREVIDGMPMRRISISLDRYAAKAVERLDAAFLEFCDAANCLQEASILTSAYESGVRAVVHIAGHRYPNSLFLKQPLFISGSVMLTTDWTGDVAKGLELRNYHDKTEPLLALLTGTCYTPRTRPEAVVYMGDDYRDEPCAEIVGRFVVAPLATDEYRQHMAQRFGSKVRTPSRIYGEVYKALTMD
ncbi:MAG: hypothetical protein ABIG30_02610 [Candidatus Aenigmatarchaeota archaeon]